MNEIIKKDSITSLELLEQINFFRKEEGREKELLHKNLLSVIRDEFEEEIGRLKIQPSTYINSQNKEQPMFVLTLNQAKQVLARESKFVRRAIIEYIEKLEKELKPKIPTNFKEALKLALEQQEQIEELENKNNMQEQIIKELKPKADYTDRILQSKALVSTTQISKDYGMSATAFNKLLNEMKIQYKQGDTWFLYQKYSKNGFTSSETIETKLRNGSSKIVMFTKWTQKGRLFLYNLLKNENILPIIEQE